MDSVSLLEKALNIRAFYQRVLASNIANVETPGYKEKDIDFVAEIERSNSRTDSIEVKEKDLPEGAAGIDANTVDIEDQLVKMTENQIMYNSYVQLLTKKFSMMKYAINEGR